MNDEARVSKMPTMPRGGKRKGSGRPRKSPPGSKSRRILVTDAELAEILELLKKLRNQEPR